MSSTVTSASVGAPFTATVTGTARIGPRRELKRAVEGYWAGRVDRAGLERIAAGLRMDVQRALVDAGLDSVPVNTFSYYDQMLDTAAMLGALPARVAHLEDGLDRYFAAARGDADTTPLEMTKWFDTNYHYIVPEIGPDTNFRLDAGKVLGELKESLDAGIPARPVIIGPITFLLLAKAVDGGADPIGRIAEIWPLYDELLGRLRDAGAGWVQLDEPALVGDLTPDQLALVARTYGRFAGLEHRPALLVTSYFGSLGPALEELATTGVEGIGIDLVRGNLDELDENTRSQVLRDKLLVAGVVNGRNVWRTDLDKALALLDGLDDLAGSVAVSTSCSLLHVPYSLADETGLDDALRSWLAFGHEKVREVVTLATARRHGAEAVGAALDECRAALVSRSRDPRLHEDDLRARLADTAERGARRSAYEQRRELQDKVLGLPVLPTTTIGSYPQTAAIRGARVALRKNEIDAREYTRRMKSEIAQVIELQERLGLDVLVHGEPERNDMVQYFAEQFEGFVATQYGWVQSYGSRCVRPPILFGEVRRPRPMTVEWIRHAQSLTSKPVKGMLTGPVTILAWSFVRDDQPLAESAQQVALAIREEAQDLESSGIRVIQVDEPALRELLPIRSADRAAYLEWAVGAFRLATGGVADDTQVHTHLCYSEFGEVIQAIADLDADVTSIEAARSRMEVLDDLTQIGFAAGVGPGVYDIHSPRVPTVDEVAASLRLALRAVPAARLWVNPDCGLKTRAPQEVEAALSNVVQAADRVRSELTA
ncbi:5-methyltetrahydropteroyltriglutamate--homocysteine S-methyltransferase [Leekyejoonella antrihumi]|uniref:5-methyltetrahydropteroyltriglutamate--homocysteine methyltransferase n=1 Tax=Leekyejoonella antrihumi TaxID=1660198 RepID=A0A563E6L0_9MICO|nr:5-methyltetrahydropteroyltriglutamate--homocysteine S-methyltransferase [Leekyejoonella antrihumi]TWP38147.1 5-methyltetrahydropteroyltriglutamate--homocysteine S-methyltransferase [Leekyejoonella antrihumi]